VLRTLLIGLFGLALAVFTQPLLRAFAMGARPAGIWLALAAAAVEIAIVLATMSAQLWFELRARGLSSRDAVSRAAPFALLVPLASSLPDLGGARVLIEWGACAFATWFVLSTLGDGLGRSPGVATPGRIARVSLVAIVALWFAKIPLFALAVLADR
jgi:hypothetical protein